MGSLLKELEKKKYKKLYKQHKASFMIQRRYHELLESKGESPEGQSFARLPYLTFKDWLVKYEKWNEKNIEKSKSYPDVNKFEHVKPEIDLEWKEE